MLASYESTQHCAVGYRKFYIANCDEPDLGFL